MNKVLHYCGACNDDTMATTTIFEFKTVAECDVCQHKTSYWKAGIDK